MKIKLKKDLENTLNMIYNNYILENNNNLNKSAIELKEHYKYVLEDLELHNCIEIK